LGTVLSPDLLEKLMPFAPVLISESQISQFTDILTKEYIQNTIMRNKFQLLKPTGLFALNLIALDPLHLNKFFMQDFSAMGKLGGFHINGEKFTDASGRYALILARPAIPMTDSHGSSEVLQLIRKSVSFLPKNVEVYVNGSYAHTEENAEVIKRDLRKILPASFSLILVLLIAFLRNTYSMVVLCVPASSLLFSIAALFVAYDDISGIVLSFGSVVLGITADYAIHTYYALQSDIVIEDALPQLSTALRACVLTTLSAFAALYFSNIPAIRQMSLFGASGILSAFAVSVFLLPHFITPKKRVILEQNDSKKFDLLPTIVVGLLFALAIMAGANSLSIDGDIRNLSWKSGKVAADEEKTRNIWGSHNEPDLIVSSGDGNEQGLEEALRINDRVWALLKSENIAASSIAPLLPSEKSQTARKDRWRQFWQHQEQGQKVLAEMENSQSKAGFSPAAFVPFLSLANPETGFITPQTLRETGMGFFLDMFVTQAENRTLVYTILSDNDKVTQDIRSQVCSFGARLISGELFRQKMAEALRGEISSFCGITLLATFGIVFLLFRSLRRGLPALLPMFAALAATLLFFHLLDISVNIFHATALPLVIALSVDYGIFMQTALEQNSARYAVKGILLSALTSLAGFGSLLMARHPALYSIGAAVIVGIASATITTIWLLPRLLQKADTQSEK
jgi:predicted exporter